MKKLMSTLVIVFALTTLLTHTGCSIPTNDLVDREYEKMAKEHELTYMEEWEELKSIVEIVAWVGANIYYRSEKVDTWSNPAETIKRGYGDCDDFTLLVMNICYVALDLKPDLVLVDTNRVVEQGGFVNHAEIRINGVNYSVYTGMALPERHTGFVYTFDEVFKGAN